MKNVSCLRKMVSWRKQLLSWLFLLFDELKLSCPKKHISTVISKSYELSKVFGWVHHNLAYMPAMTHNFNSLPLDWVDSNFSFSHLTIHSNFIQNVRQGTWASKASNLLLWLFSSRCLSSFFSSSWWLWPANFSSRTFQAIFEALTNLHPSCICSQ